MNLGYKFLLAELGRTVTEKTKTASTVASQQFYQMPPDFLWLKDLTVTVGSTTYPTTEIVDQEEWDYLNQTSQTSDIPTFIFVRPYWGVSGAEVGIFPIPASAGNTINLVYEAGDKDLSVAAYTTGTVTMINGSATVTGSGTTFTAAMVGRYFTITTAGGDGQWYKIASRTSNTVITLENYYDGISGSSLNYKIAEAFALPEEMQILPVYYALQHYFAMKKDADQETKYLTLFNAGLIQAKRRYGTKSRSAIIKKNPWKFSGGSVYPFYFPSEISS